MPFVALHALLRWVVLGGLAAAAGAGLAGLVRPGARPAARWTSLAAAVAMDVEVALGALLWLGQSAWASHGAFTAWIHPAAMAVALVLAHLGATRAGRGGRRDLLTAVAGTLGAAVLVLTVVPGGPLGG